MQQPDLRTREAKAGQGYMKRKGYTDVRPKWVVPIEGQECWYFFYELEEGNLELEVRHDDDWRFRVTSFSRR